MPRFPYGLWLLEMTLIAMGLAWDMAVDPAKIAPLPVRTWEQVGTLFVFWSFGFAALHYCRLNWHWQAALTALAQPPADDESEDEWLHG
jgi:hypothetical protein